MSRKVVAASPAPKNRAAQEAQHREITEFLNRYESAFRATARRFSRTDDDAEDALQRSIEILLTRAPAMEPRARMAWMHVVVRHEALRLRRLRQKQALPSGDPSQLPEGGAALLGGPRPESTDPAELFERSDEFTRFRQAFSRLKRNERRALSLIGAGHSYREIEELTGWSYTKINRLLAEGRAKMRDMLGRLESGQRCAELAGPLSRLCDGEASPQEERELKEHLRGCMACRATLRSYRLTGAKAALVFPLEPVAGQLNGRFQEMAAWLQSRLPGRGSLTEAALAIPTGGGGGGGQGGFAALAKLAIICVGASGGTAACIATGVLPPPDLPAIEKLRPGKSDETEQVAEATGNTAPGAPEAAAPAMPAAGPGSPPAAEKSGQAQQAPDGGRKPDEEEMRARRNPEQAEFGVEGAGQAIRLRAPVPPAAHARASEGGSPAPRSAGAAAAVRAPTSDSAAGEPAGAAPPPVRPPLVGGEAASRPPLKGGEEEFGP